MPVLFSGSLRRTPPSLVALGTVICLFWTAPAQAGMRKCPQLLIWGASLIGLVPAAVVSKPLSVPPSPPVPSVSEATEVEAFFRKLQSEFEIELRIHLALGEFVSANHRQQRSAFSRLLVDYDSEFEERREALEEVLQSFLRDELPALSEQAQIQVLEAFAFVQLEETFPPFAWMSLSQELRGDLDWINVLDLRANASLVALEFLFRIGTPEAWECISKTAVAGLFLTTRSSSGYLVPDEQPIREVAMEFLHFFPMTPAKQEGIERMKQSLKIDSLPRDIAAEVPERLLMLP